MSTPHTPPLRTTYRIPLVLARMAIVAPMCALIGVDYGFRRPLLAGNTIHVLQLVLFGVYVAYAAARLKVAPRFWQKLRNAWFDWLLIGLGVADLVTSILAGDNPLAGWNWHVMEAAFVGMLLWQCVRLYVSLVQRFYAGPAILPVSFATAIFTGTVLLKLPVAVPDGEAPLSWLDSLFTATSAVCVTGLIVRDTAHEFTWYGQAVILGLIQFGALGISVFGTLMAMMLGGRMTLREAAHVGGAIGNESIHRVRRMVVFIMVVTVAVELFGALTLAGLWRIELGLNERSFDALFHAISAFCNAGFSTNTDSLVPYRDSAAVLGVISTLIVVGGIGFPVLFNVAEVLADRVRQFRSDRRQAKVRLNLHSRMVLWTTLVLLVGGGVLLGITQSAGPRGSAAETPVTQRAIDAGFNSITARTAGFNAMPMDELTPASRFVLMGLMFVGGSPASTAGGIKTVTLMVLLMAAVATARGRENTEGFGRTLGVIIMRRAATVVLAMLTLVVVATIVLCISEPGVTAETAMFEVISATGTVGLSLGLTAKLTAIGRIVIIACMFLGRVGPLVMLTALMAGRIKRVDRAYATEMVVLG